MASSPPSMLHPMRSPAMAVLPSRGVGPLFMTTGDGESESGGGDGPDAVPVDAELSEPAAEVGGGAGEGGGEGAGGDPATRAALKQKLLRKGMDSVIAFFLRGV